MESLLDTSKMNIIQLVTHLWSHGESWVQSWFANLNFEFCPPESVLNTTWEHKIFRISYTQNPIDWTPKWTRQCRGIIILIQENTVTILRYLMERGEEVVSHHHIGHSDLLGQVANVSSSRLQTFDQRQQFTINQLQQDGPIDGYLTMKVDGMLCVLTFYSGKLRDIMTSIIRQNDNSFANALLDHCIDKSYLVVISTQNTLTINDYLTQTYVTTAILSTIGFGQDLSEQINDMFSPTDAMLMFGGQLVSHIDGFYEIGYESNSISFEAVCCQVNGYSTCQWGFQHREFAILYDMSFVTVLSRSADLTVTQHYQFSDLIHSLGFNEPFFWRINMVSQINNMLGSLTNVALNRITREQFLKQFPPQNISWHSQQALDFEGFVLHAFALGEYHYNKIKLLIYYILHDHKMRIEDIATLYEIGRSNPRLSLKGVNTANFFDTVNNKWNYIIDDLIQQVNCPLDSNQLYNDLDEKKQKILCILDNKRQLWKIMMSFSGEDKGWYLICNQIVTKYFPELSRSKMKLNQINKILHEIVNKIMPWETDYDVRLLQMVHNLCDDIKKFYIAITWINEEVEEANILSFYRIGCKQSTDYDFMVELQTYSAVLMAKHGQIDMRHKLSEITGVTINKLDINYFYGNPPQLFSKGNRNLSWNILWHTYHLHDQSFPLQILQAPQINLCDMVRGFYEFVLKELEVLIGDKYREIRGDKIAVFKAKGGHIRNEFILSILQHVKEFDSDKSRDVIKSFVVKAIQIIITSNSICRFTKEEMACEFNKLCPGTFNNALYHLFRGKQGIYKSSFLGFLCIQVISVIQKNTKPLIWHKIPVNFDKNPTMMPDGMYHEFWENPIDPTPKYKGYFYQVEKMKDGSRDFNKFFSLKSKNIHLLPLIATIVEFSNDLSTSLGHKSIQPDDLSTSLGHKSIQPDDLSTSLGHKSIQPDDLSTSLGPIILTCDQRSPEWHHWRSIYPNGSGTEEGKFDFKTAENCHHIISGCIAEECVTEYGDFSVIPELTGFDLVMVGLVINSEKTTNVAPDFLMTNGTLVYPGEIKRINGPFNDNSDFNRGIILATHQLKGAARILQLGKTKGIIVIVNIFKLEGQVKREARVSLIDL
jgi:hypothetical protein